MGSGMRGGGRLGYDETRALVQAADVALDEAVAREFMRWQPDRPVPLADSEAYFVQNIWWKYGDCEAALVREWHPSADPVAMMRVMSHDRWPVGGALVKSGSGTTEEWCVAYMEGPMHWRIDASTAASRPGLAVCRAALKAARGGKVMPYMEAGGE